MKLPLSLLVLAASASPAAAQVTPVAPFTGSHQEGFETQTGHSGSQPCMVGRVFNGTGDLCATGSVLRSSGWSFMCTIQERSGTRFAGANIGYAFFTFDAPVQTFGGYFGTNGSPGVVSVRFYDAGGALIDQTTANVPADCNWYWNGWRTLGASIRRVEIENSVHGGCHVMMDDMQIDAGPPPPVGTSYCGPANPNSTGFPGTITGSGSASVAANDLTLTADGLPPGQFGYFLTGQTQGFFNPPGSQGNICLTGNIGRYNQVANIIQGPTGSIAVDLTSLPVNPPQTAQPGETWSFQCWFRDNNPGLTSNFTDGLQVAFL